MKVETLRSLSLLASLVLPGCILVTDGSELGLDDSGDTDGWEDDGWDDESTGESGSTTGAWDTDAWDTDAGSTGTGGEDGPACGENLLSDPGFEAGAPSEAWTEASALFGTPLCDGTCSEDEGAQPHDGQWWVWFGGVADAESASVAQGFTADAVEARLRLHVAINAASGTGEDALTVSIDDTEVFRLTDADAADYGDYVPVEIDVSAFADGQPHTLTLAGEMSGDGMTSFFVDDVGLFMCDEPDDDGTGSTGGGSSTGDSGSSSSGDAGDTGDTESGSSSTGG